MKIFISVDIEGVAGVVALQEGQPGNAEYERARRLMTAEANAAIAGAFDGGATEVVVNDSHGPMVNLLPEELDARAELIRGNIKPFGMFAGVDASFAGAMCVGYHAAAGDRGVLAHTTAGVFTAVRLNGSESSEASIYGAHAGSMGVPVILVSGDDVIVDACRDLFAGAQLVQVKTALSQRAARSVAPSVACERIRRAAAEAVGGARAGAAVSCGDAVPDRVRFRAADHGGSVRADSGGGTGGASDGGVRVRHGAGCGRVDGGVRGDGAAAGVRGRCSRLRRKAADVLDQKEQMQRVGGRTGEVEMLVEAAGWRVLGMDCERTDTADIGGLYGAAHGVLEQPSADALALPRDG